MCRSSSHTLAAFLLLTAFGSSGCGESEQLPPPPPLVKLVDLPEAELREVPVVGGREPIVRLQEDFCGGFADWIAIEDAEDPAAGSAGELLVSTAETDDGCHLSLIGPRGGLTRTLPIRAGRPHRFSGRIRVHGPQPEDLPSVPGARFVLLEMGGEILAVKDMRAGWGDQILERHAPRVSLEEDGWQEVGVDFTTHPDATWLLVTCDLNLSGEVVERRADFADVELLEIPRSIHWKERIEEAVRARRPGDPLPEGWRGRRLVGANLLHDLRPSIACMPGEAIRFRVRIPEGDALFRTGVGAWSEMLRAYRGETLRFEVHVNGELAHVEEFPVPETFLDCPWHEVELDLSPWRGGTVELELAVSGGVIGVWGSPHIVDSSIEPSKPNVILISIDTVRADHMGCYGYALETTPNIDRFAEESILFEDVTAQSPYTLPSHISMLSGQFPSVHGVQDRGDSPSSARTPILAEILGENGYRTQAFVGGGFVSRSFGFDRGFDSFSPIDPIRHRDSWFFETWIEDHPETMSAELADRLLVVRLRRWLRENREEPFFLFVHTYAVHAFESPPEYLEHFEGNCGTDWDRVRQHLRTPAPRRESLDDAQAAHLLHCYDGALRYTDAMIGRLLVLVDEIGLRDRTVVVITSDHGEEILDRGSVQHGLTLYEELTRIPLIARVPGVQPRRDPRPAMHVDIAPTILSAVGIEKDSRMLGIDLIPDEDRPDRLIWSEVDTEVTKYALRLPSGWKVIQGSGKWELYDLKSDPAERDERGARDGDNLERMKQVLMDTRASLEALGENLGSKGGSEIDEQTIEQLRKLGYL